MTNEEKAIKVMQYIADNEKEIKKAIQKNTTAVDEDFLNDIFQEATLKMAETIMKNGTEIKDMKNFVYISMRNLYIIKQNQLRKKNTIMTNEYENIKVLADETDNEERFKHINSLICDIKCSVIEEFGIETADMFMDYWSSKAMKDGSYQAMGKKYDMTPRVCSQIIKKVKDYIENDTDLYDKYQEIINDDYERF